jgi:RNA ligase (TIGR02306 family)
LSKYVGTKCYITEKVDGSSISIYYKGGKMGVCSRNLDINADSSNKFWQAVLSLDMENKLKKYGQDIVLQGELLGEGVQGNKYKLTQNIILFYNAWDIKTQMYYSYAELVSILNELELTMVPVLNYNYELSAIIPDLVEMSRGYSVLNEKILREGIVIRPLTENIDFDFRDKLPGGRISFKAVNPEFLLKYSE